MPNMLFRNFFHTAAFVFGDLFQAIRVKYARTVSFASFLKRRFKYFFHVTLPLILSKDNYHGNGYVVIGVFIKF